MIAHRGPLSCTDVSAPALQVVAEAPQPPGRVIENFVSGVATK